MAGDINPQPLFFYTMIKLFKYEQFKLTISEEALLLKPIKAVWDRDKSKNKQKALMELGCIYFMNDLRSDYQYLVDEEERTKAIITGEGMPANWKPDKVVLEASIFYNSFKPTASLLLEDIRFMIDQYRKKLRTMASEGFEELSVKELKDINALIKALPGLIKDLDETERALASEMRSSSKMRGQGEKTIFEDDLNL